MALVKKGAPNFGLILQPGHELVFERDGSVRGRRVLEGDVTQWERDAFVIGSAYPEYPSVECFTSQVTFLECKRVRVTLDYIGLSSSPTPYEYELIGSMSEEPIESHPRFSSMAGTAASPATGAMFDPDTGEFIGFNASASTGLAGVQGYLSPSVIIRRSYWAYQLVQPYALGSVGGGFNLPLPAGVGNFLVTGFSWRQLGRVYQVTEEFTGSGRNGWAAAIYG